MGSLSGIQCLHTGHCAKSKYVFLALDGLEAEQLESMTAPIAELRSLPGCADIIGVIVSCAGTGSLPHLPLIHLFRHMHAGHHEQPAAGKLHVCRA